MNTKQRLNALIKILYDGDIIGREHNDGAFVSSCDFVPTEHPYNVVRNMRQAFGKLHRLMNYLGLEEVNVDSPQVRKKKKSKNPGTSVPENY